MATGGEVSSGTPRQHAAFVVKCVHSSCLCSIADTPNPRTGGRCSRQHGHLELMRGDGVVSTARRHSDGRHSRGYRGKHPTPVPCGIMLPSRQRTDWQPPLGGKIGKARALGLTPKVCVAHPPPSVAVTATDASPTATAVISRTDPVILTRTTLGAALLRRRLQGSLRAA